MDHVVILNNGTISGLITRQLFYSLTGGPFWYQLMQKKPIESLCKPHPLIVEDK
jgi:hypothetical protein